MNPGDPNGKPGDYERPTGRFVCGRGANWCQPCPFGPAPDGKCGGTHECQPGLRKGRPECRRAEGGPCGTGPHADGTCSQIHPPCVPRLALRARRGRLLWQAAMLTVIFIGVGFHFGSKTKTAPPSADAGPLSAKHANFTAPGDCVACHESHDGGFGPLVRAAFSARDMNSRCTHCHAFAGPVNRPHNEAVSTAAGRDTDCRLCHTEHRGANGNLSPLTDAQCHACHRVKFERFDRGHPAFAESFPHAARNGIKFNHARHLQEHFLKPENRAQAPRHCVDCHAAPPGEPTLRTAGFDAACARCHAGQIPQNELVLLRLPEPGDPAALAPDDATPFMAWLLQRGTNAGAYGGSLRQLLAGVARDGAAPLGRALGELGAANGGDGLLAGLNPELLTRPAAAWLGKQKFEPPATKPASGWYWFEDLLPELRYQPATHGDAVARAWLEFALAAAARETNAPDAKRAGQFRDEAAQARTGVGRCVKCHTVNQGGLPERWWVDWRYRGSQLRAHTRFSHGAHLGVRSCTDCHALNPQADYDKQFDDPRVTRGVSGFTGLTTASCTTCHAAGKIRSDCRLCHEYHKGPAVKELKLTHMNNSETRSPKAPIPAVGPGNRFAP